MFNYERIISLQKQRLKIIILGEFEIKPLYHNVMPHIIPVFSEPHSSTISVSIVWVWIISYLLLMLWIMWELHCLKVMFV